MTRTVPSVCLTTVQAASRAAGRWPAGASRLTARIAPAGLQRTLRADGVPASVIFNPKLPRRAPFRDLFRVQHNPCRFSRDQGQLLKVVTGPPHRLRAGSTLATIHPAALPHGDGVQFIATPNTGYPQSGAGRFAVGVILVQASPGCTGS